MRLETAVEMDMAQSMKRHELRKELEDIKEQTSYFMERINQEISTAVRKQTSSLRNHLLAQMSHIKSPFQNISS